MILVTGATGLVGGHLVWLLLAENETVRAIRRKNSNTEPLKKVFSFYTENPAQYLKRIEWITADVNDKSSLLEAMKDVTDVYHCAAVVSLGKGNENLTDTNVVGTRNMVEAALQSHIRKFCFVSSIAACGKVVENKVIDENSVWEENVIRNIYAKSKYYSEQEIWNGIKKGLNAVIVNPGVILGVSGAKSGSVELFYQVKKGMPFYTLGGSGYVAVQDVVKAMILLMKSDISSERFILVGENCTNKQILTWIALGFGKTPPFINIWKEVLLPVGYLSEIAGKLFRFKPLIDRSFARTALNKELFSSEKIISAINIQFTPIEKCIRDVCSFMSDKHFHN
jgi:dihydroflavonol-4-reductase